MINSDCPDFLNTPVSSSRPAFSYSPQVGHEAAPVVSVITAFYNTDQVFLETARTVLGQSFQNIEWILVDDGSSNQESLQYLRQVQNSDPRVRVITQPNAGPAVARNNAASHARGRYLCLLDSDDLLEPTFIEKCVWFLESNPEFACCNSRIVNFGAESFLWPFGFDRGAKTIEANAISLIAMIRRDIFLSVGGFDETIKFGHEDWDFWLSLANVGKWGYTLPEYLGWYRKRPSGRFHQVMNSAQGHSDSEALILEKYADLAHRFPVPVIKSPIPYEQVPEEIPFSNCLGKPAGKKRLLYLMPWMVTGGADRVNLDWIAELTKAGYEVTICATLPSSHNWQHLFEALTPDVFVLPNFLRTCDFPRFLAYLIGSRQIDVVITSNATFGYLILPYLRSCYPNVAYVDLSHVEEPHWLNGGHPRFGVGYQEMLDLNIVTTANLRKWMVGRGADEDRIAVCYTGIDVSVLEKHNGNKGLLKEALSLESELPVIVFAGRLCEQKRPLFLVEILGQLASRGLTFQALLIGDGELRGALEERIAALNIGKYVRLLGSVDHDRWLNVLAASDILLLPSLYEGISVALLEAMGMAVVPVTAPVGGQQEIVLPDCGVLIGPGETELDDYTQALARLLQNATLRSAMGQNARKQILEKMSRQATTSKLLETLDRAVALSHEAPRVTLPKRFGHELATSAVEYTRLDHVAGMLWTHWVAAGAAANDNKAPIPMNGLVRLIMLFGNTRFGNRILSSRRLRRWGLKLMARMEARNRPPQQ